MRHRLDVALFSAFFVAFTLSTSALAQPADLVLRGGRVITVDKDWRVAQAVAIRDGRFLAVGDDAAIAGHIGPNTQVIELAGKTVVPGLIDSHLHQLFAGLNGPAVQLLGSRTVAEVQNSGFHCRSASREPGNVLIAVGTGISDLREAACAAGTTHQDAERLPGSGMQPGKGGSSPPVLERMPPVA